MRKIAMVLAAVGLLGWGDQCSSSAGEKPERKMFKECTLDVKVSGELLAGLPPLFEVTVSNTSKQDIASLAIEDGLMVRILQGGKPVKAKPDSPEGLRVFVRRLVTGRRTQMLVLKPGKPVRVIWSAHGLYPGGLAPGKYTLSLTYYSSVAADAPEGKKGEVQLGELYLTKNVPFEVKAPPRAERRSYQAFSKGTKAFLVSADPKESTKHFATVVDRHPTSKYALYSRLMLGNALTQVDNMPKAKSVLEPYLAQEKQCPYLYEAVQCLAYAVLKSQSLAEAEKIIGQSKLDAWKKAALVSDLKSQAKSKSTPTAREEILAPRLDGDRASILDPRMTKVDGPSEGVYYQGTPLSVYAELTEANAAKLPGIKEITKEVEKMLPKEFSATLESPHSGAAKGAAVPLVLVATDVLDLDKFKRTPGGKLERLEEKTKKIIFEWRLWLNDGTTKPGEYVVKITHLAGEDKKGAVILGQQAMVIREAKSDTALCEKSLLLARYWIAQGNKESGAEDKALPHIRKAMKLTPKDGYLYFLGADMLVSSELVTGEEAKAMKAVVADFERKKKEEEAKKVPVLPKELKPSGK